MIFLLDALQDCISAADIVELKPNAKKVKRTTSGLHNTKSLVDSGCSSCVENSDSDNSIELFTCSDQSIVSHPSHQLITYDNPYKLGKWSEQLSSLWQFKFFDINAETQFNERRSLQEPHCCVCQIFVPKVANFLNMTSF